jgi:hypothetical protein
MTRTAEFNLRVALKSSISSASKKFITFVELEYAPLHSHHFNID